MAGKKLGEIGFTAERVPAHVAVKESVFPFGRFPGVDTILGPEMKSTGEVMGIDATFAMAFAKAELAASSNLPDAGRVFISVRDEDKRYLEPIARGLVAMGFDLIATRGTSNHIRNLGLECERVNKVLEGSPHIVDAMKRWAGRDGRQHAGRERHEGFVLDSAHRAGTSAAVLHDDGGGEGGGRGNLRAQA